jgi:hypothetical protein
MITRAQKTFVTPGLSRQQASPESSLKNQSLHSGLGALARPGMTN